MPKLVLTLTILAVTSAVTLLRAHASPKPDGADCTTNDDCINDRCASVTKKCCQLTYDNEPCESDFCKGSDGLFSTEGHGRCNDAWYTDYLNSGISFDAIEVVSAYSVEITTVPDAIFAMTGLTSLTLVGSGVINGLSDLTNLKTLRVPYPHTFTGGQVQPLSPALTSLSNLETLVYTPGWTAEEQTYSIELAEAWADSLTDVELNDGSMAQFLLKLTKLTFLHISNVRDTGSWPATFGSQLSDLQYWYLDLATSLDLPSTLFSGNTALTYLSLARVSSASPLPSSIWDLGTLTDLSLSYFNAVNGIPTTLSSLSNLELLSLYGFPALTGSLPVDLVSLPELLSLQIGFIPNLSGSIPEDIDNLTTLEALEFSGCDSLTGAIPISVGDMTNLKFLRLSDMNIVGTVPELSDLNLLTSLTLEKTMLESLEGMNNLVNLTYVKLQYNSALTEMLPVFDLPALTSLMFRNHANYESALEIDSWNLPKLQILQLEGNLKTPITDLPTFQGKGELHTFALAQRFGGTLPAVWGTNAPKLKSIALRGFPLSGTIPSEYANLSNLQTLSLASSGLTGSFPSELGGLPYLQTMELDNNGFVGSLQTFVPEVNGKSKYFTLEGNSFTGSLPSIQDLRTFKADGNSFTGTFPSEFFSFNKQIEQLYLRDNNLTGTLPNIDSTGAVVELTLLDKLHMPRNALSGTLPSWVTNHKRALSIDDNKFSGTIPSPIAEFPTSVLFIDGGNRWVGGIPTNMTVQLEGNALATDVVQSQTWPFIASGESCASSPTLCTAGENMCGENNKVCCARIDGNGKTCSTGNCAPSSSPIPGECLYTAAPTMLRPTNIPTFAPTETFGGTSTTSLSWLAALAALLTASCAAGCALKM